MSKEYRPSRLIDAAKRGAAELVEEYLTDQSKKIDVNKTDSLGETSLHWAARGSHVDTINVLINQGADLNIVDKKGETALHKAAWKSQSDAIRVLVQNGANIEIRNNDGKLAIEVCAESEARKYLIPQTQLDESDESFDMSDDDSD